MHEPENFGPAPNTNYFSRQTLKGVFVSKEIEMERTYLAREIPQGIKSTKPKEIIDIMFPIDAVHPQLRLRKHGDKYMLTKKYPVDQSNVCIQVEETITLSKPEYEEFAKLPGKRIAKDRYNIIINGASAEVDIFKEALKGLVLIEFEFESETDLNSFIPPKCTLADVTQEEFIAGGMLAGKSYADISAKLLAFGYRPLL